MSVVCVHDIFCRLYCVKITQVFFPSVGKMLLYNILDPLLPKYYIPTMVVSASPMLKVISATQKVGTFFFRPVSFLIHAYTSDIMT